MKVLLLFLAFCSQVQTNSKTSTVYICDSRGGKKYHLRNDCRGLSHCTHHIIAITVEDAKKRGMDLCGFEK